MNCQTCGIEIPFASTIKKCSTCKTPEDKLMEYDLRLQGLKYRISKGVSDGHLPENMMDYKFKNSDPAVEELNPKMWEFLKAWDVTKGSIWLWGAPGCGKSHSSLMVGLRAMWNNKCVIRLNARRFVRILQRFKEGEDTFDQWKEADVLIFDDIDKMNVSEHNVTALWDLFDAVSMRRGAFIITSNLDASALRTTWMDKLDNPTQVSATLDRLKPCTVIEVKGDSMRGKVVRLPTE